ncbi:Wzy polymerase domain-containing protein [Pantoea ananatis]|uniref:PglL family O-oligosaccharyltransferase n=1 Tax=Pantoea ananas TaxID=553 RepID=UPI001FF4A8D7|nr:Wzy polymerase domain-containing protein [Pantoea ananatis]MCK0552717.1 Wzy polymerase domain-containing protein [Pantoea ananatis]
MMNTYTHKVSAQKKNRGILAALSFWLCGGLLYVLPNSGGSGLSLPQNLLTWAVISLILTISILSKDFTIKAFSRFSSGEQAIIIGVLAWSFPLFLTRDLDWFQNALPRVTALILLTLLYFILSRAMGGRLKNRYCLLNIIIIACVLQGGYAIVQLIKSPADRPYGSFQQVNVLSSFLATGLNCLLFIFLRKKTHHRALLLYWYALGILLLTSVIVVLQSRAAFIGFGCGVIILLISGLITKRNRFLPAFFLLLSGIGIGLFVLYIFPMFFPDAAVPVIIKAESTSSRLYMTQLTIELIMQSPIVGHGYGGFEAVFGQLAATNLPGLEAATLTHPHNEILYAWLEGGLISLVGLLLMIAGVLMKLWERGALKRYGIALLLPLAAHMNLEYPLYQSVTHGLMLVLLLVIAGSIPSQCKTKEAQNGYGKKNSFQIIRCFLFLISIFMIYFSLTGLITQQRLTQIEKKGLQEFTVEPEKKINDLPNYYSQRTRIDFDYHVAMLLTFNKTRNPALLSDFQQWGWRFLKTHNDPNIYDSMMKISQFQQTTQYHYLCAEAHGRWPKDKRFIC